MLHRFSCKYRDFYYTHCIYSIATCYYLQVLQLEHCSPTDAGHASLSETTAKGKKFRSSTDVRVHFIDQRYSSPFRMQPVLPRIQSGPFKYIIFT